MRSFKLPQVPAKGAWTCATNAILASLLLISLPLPAQWRALGPFGGSAAVVQVDPHRPDTTLVATSNGLLFRSTDGGYMWKPVPFPAALQGTLHAFVIDPKVRDVYLAGLSSDSPGYSGLFRTRDGGVTWQLLPGLKKQQVWSIAIWPADPRVIAAGTHEGVFLSRDGGETFARISSAGNRELRPVVSLAFDPSNSKVIYAGTPHLPWKTVNGGVTWRSIHTGMADDSDVFSIDIDRKQPQRVFASACSGIYRSLNGGVAWRKLIGAKGASYRTYFVAQDPFHAGVVYAGTNHGLVRSVNGGTTWRPLSEHPTRWIAFDPWHPWRVFVVTDNAGILRSNDSGKTFQSANDGFCNRYLPIGALQLATATGSLRPLPSGQQVLALAAAPDNPQRLYAAGYRNLLASNDAGRTWISIPTPPRSSRITALLVGSAPRPAAGPPAGFLLAATEAALYRTANEGKDWSKVELPIARQPIRSLVRLGPTLSCAIAGSRIFLSQDGVIWKSTGVISGNTEVLGVAATGRETIFAATSQGLMRSDDLGSSWRSAGGALDGNTVTAICAHPTQSGVLFAAQYGNIYMSNDNGHSWRRTQSESLLVSSILELQVLPGTPDRLFALSRSQGTFGLSLEARASVSSTAP